MAASALQFRANLEHEYDDILTPTALATLAALAPLDADRKTLMRARIERRNARARDKRRIAFLDPTATIAGTRLTVQQARDGAFAGSEIPHDLQRQWIQGTGPAARPNTPVATSIRNVAYALLSGADGWMFDGEDALGQLSSMSLDNQRNLKLAIHDDPLFLKTADAIAAEMNQWAHGLLQAPHRRRHREAADVHDQDLSSARAAPRRPADASRRWHRLFGLHRRRHALHRQQLRADA